MKASRLYNFTMKLRPNYKHLYILIALSILISFFVVKIPTSLNLQSITLFISAAAGYSGIMLLLWTFILGTRSVVALLFDDYAQVLKLHSWIGKYGTLLIFLHPILLMISYGQSLPFVFMPNFSSQFENAITYGKSAFYIILVIWLSSALLKKQMSQRPWKYLHLAAYVVIPFALLHIPYTGSSYTTMLSARIYFFSVIIGFAIFGLLRLRGALNLNKFKYLIISNIQVAPEIFELRLKPIDEHLPKVKPGQYIYIKQNNIGEDHPFSMFNYNQTTGELIIGYKACGKFTKQLSKQLSGKKVLLSGPFGLFTQDITDKPVVYIAGGIGVAPFAYRLLNEPNNRQQWLFYINKTKQNAAFSDQLKSRCNNLISIYTRQESSGERNTETGHLKSDFLKKYLHDPTIYTYYICGPEAMVDSTVRILENNNVPVNNIHKELFSF